MVTKLFVPERRIVAPKPPSYIKLDMAFAIGAGAKLMDKSRYRSHGTISGASWADGAHGRCLDFDPTVPSYVEIPAAYTQLNFTSEDFSMVFTLYLDSLTINSRLFTRGNDNVDGYLLFLHTDANFYFRTNQFGPYQHSYTSMGSLTTGKWYRLGVSRSGTSIRLYIDGVDRTVGSPVHTDPATCSRSAKLGVEDNKVGRPLDGKVGFLRVFGGIALSASEHLAWHNALK